MAEGEESSFAQRLALVVKKRFASRAELARKTGVSPSALQGYLGGSEPGLGALVAIAKAGNVSIGWLATGEGRGPMGEGERDFAEGREVLAYCLRMIKEIDNLAGWKLSPSEETFLIMVLQDFIERELENEEKVCPNFGEAVALLRAKLAEIRPPRASDVGEQGI